MGGNTTVQQPTPPAPPTQTETLAEYIKNYPQLVALEKQYSPELAALEKSIQTSLYPQQAALGEQLAGVASQGMEQSAPDWYQKNVSDTLKSQFGRNLVYNPQAQEQYGVATAQANEDWNRYYQNLGLSLSNKMPIVQGQQNAVQSFTPATALNYASSTYSPYVGSYTSMYGTNAQLSQQSSPWMNIAGSMAGGLAGGLGQGFGMAGYSKLFK